MPESREKDCGKNGIYKESATACPKGLIRVCGVDYTPDSLAARLNKNADVTANGGGITFSGGEPLLRADFIVATSALLDPRLTVALQTSGYTDEATLKGTRRMRFRFVRPENNRRDGV
ncbi:MAG: hypothetical protein ACLUSP_05510 [Christensenellales bacterium]